MHTIWKEWLKDETTAPYFLSIREFIRNEIMAGKVIYPDPKDFFNALKHDPTNIKVVILGQDPYHNPNEAHGLSFSVLNKKPPPSLMNIYKELETEGFVPKKDGNLTYWADQGILLLNTYLSVEKNTPKSHRKIGWEKFTDACITQLNQHLENVVYILWGNDALTKDHLIDHNKNLVLKSAHPSFFSAHRGFFGNNHFRLTNDYLKKIGKAEIVW